MNMTCSYGLGLTYTDPKMCIYFLSPHKLYYLMLQLFPCVSVVGITKCWEAADCTALHFPEDEHTSAPDIKPACISIQEK